MGVRKKKPCVRSSIGKATKGPGAASFQRKKWKVIVDKLVVRAEEWLVSGVRQECLKDTILEQTGAEVVLKNEENISVTRIPVAHASSPSYPQPIGWVRRRQAFSFALFDEPTENLR